MKYIFRTAGVITLITILFSSADAQDSLRRFRTSGGLIGYGKAINKETDYKIIFLAGDFSWSFTKYPKRKDFVAWYLEPQVNPVRTPRPWDIEFGVNLGLRNYIRINEGLYFYQMLGTGPHYISAEVKRQANGFIFSDNFALGAFTRINQKNLFLNIQFRWRHLSNAGLEKPNSGIDSWNIFLGLSRFN
jgi:hypothetical protein